MDDKILTNEEIANNPWKLLADGRIKYYKKWKGCKKSGMFKLACMWEYKEELQIFMNEHDGELRTIEEAISDFNEFDNDMVKCVMSIMDVIMMKERSDVLCRDARMEYFWVYTRLPDPLIDHITEFSDLSQE